MAELGTLRIETTLSEAESRVQQKRIIFDPIPRIEGVEASDDPLLDIRANVYLISGQQRRSATGMGTVEGDSIEAVKATT